MKSGSKEEYDLIRQSGLQCGWRWVRKAILGRRKIMNDNFGTGKRGWGHTYNNREKEQ